MKALARPPIAQLPAGLAAIAYRGGAALASSLPEPLARRAGHLIGLLCWALQRERRATVRLNLARRGLRVTELRAAGPPAASSWASARARGAFGNFGESVVDTLRLARMEPGEVARRVSVEGLERLEGALEAGGAVLLAAHSGNWEWAGAALAARGFHVAAVARPHAAGPQGFFDRLRARFGVATSPALRDLLARPQPPVIGVFCDRSAGAHAAREPERVARGALAVAARRGWKAFPALALRAPRGYRVLLGPAIAPARTVGARREAARRALAFLDWNLRACPEQWFAFEPLGPAHDPARREPAACAGGGVMAARDRTTVAAEARR